MDKRAREIGATEECPVFELIRDVHWGKRGDVVEFVGIDRNGFIRARAPWVVGDGLFATDNPWIVYPHEVRPLTRAGCEIVAEMAARRALVTP